MTKPLIAVDLDDVLADENGAMRLFSNERLDANFTEEEFNVRGEWWGYWEKVIGLTDEEGERHYEAFLNSEHKSNQQIVPGALEAIRALKHKYRLAIVTARPNILIEQTHEWLDRHFPGTFEDVQFMSLWRETDPTASKAMICNHLGASVLIDDNVKHCRLAAEAGLTAILFGNYGWNWAEELPVGVERIDNWEAVCERLGVS